jgi:hypothetical protein
VTGNQRPGEALPNPGGKAVASAAPGAGPRDASGDVARQWEGNDARLTAPPGGYPQTVGGNPDGPAKRQVSDEDETGVTVQAPGPYSQATQWIGGGAADVTNGSY